LVVIFLLVWGRVFGTVLWDVEGTPCLVVQLVCNFAHGMPIGGLSMPGESNDNRPFYNFSEYGFDQLQGGVNQQKLDQKTSSYLPSSCPSLVGLVPNSYFPPRVPLYLLVALGVPFQPRSSPYRHRARHTEDFVFVGGQPSSVLVQSRRDGGEGNREALCLVTSRAEYQVHQAPFLDRPWWHR